MQRVLLLEDNQTLADTIAYSLGSRDLRVHAVPSLDQAYSLLDRYRFDLAIVDRMLEDGDGLELVNYLSQEAAKLKIVIISHKANITEKLIGLRSGAFDYLAKPLHLEELRLKCWKHLQQARLEESARLSCGNIQLQLETGLMQIGKRKQQLRKREAEILACLIRHQNYVVSRDKIISRVWTMVDEIPLHSTLDVYIRRLRLKMGKERERLQTVRGYGFKLVAATRGR